jgi:hypothetical protein
MFEEQASKESIWFGTAMVCIVAAVSAYSNDMTVTAGLSVAASVYCASKFFKGPSDTESPGGTAKMDPDPNDEWFKIHPYWTPDTEPGYEQANPWHSSHWRQGCRREDPFEVFRRQANRTGYEGHSTRSRANPSSSFSDAEARALLGIHDRATAVEAKTAYRDAAMQAHPDHGGTHEAFLRVQAAWDHVKPTYE